MSTSKEFDFFEPDGIKYIGTFDSLRLCNRNLWKTGWEIPFETYSQNNITSNFDKTSEQDLQNFKNVSSS